MQLETTCLALLQCQAAAKDAESTEGVEAAEECWGTLRWGRSTACSQLHRESLLRNSTYGDRSEPCQAAFGRKKSTPPAGQASLPRKLAMCMPVRKKCVDSRASPFSSAGLVTRCGRCCDVQCQSLLHTRQVSHFRQALRGLLAGEDGDKKEGQIIHLVGALPFSVGASGVTRIYGHALPPPPLPPLHGLWCRMPPLLWDGVVVGVLGFWV